MSRQPSPPPHNQHMYHQIPLAPSSSRQKTKPHVVGIAAGAEDVKYQAKYKELRKKVKEIELDNDRLYLKLLLAKKNIRRMNLERAILYERLAAVPPTPGRQPQELPAEHDPMFAAQAQAQAPPDLARPAPDDIDEYLRANPNARVITDPEGRAVVADDGPRGALGVSVPPRAAPPPPAYRHEQPAEYGAERAHIPAPRPDSPPAQLLAAAYHTRREPSPHAPSPSRLDTFPPAAPAHSRSASPAARPPHHAHAHATVPSPNLPPSPSSHSAHSPTHGRLHNHQRIGPGVHLHRGAERDPEERRQLLLEREKERERELERAEELRVRMRREQEEAYWAEHPGRAESPREDSEEEERFRAWGGERYEAHGRGHGHAHPHAHGGRFREGEGYYERERGREYAPAEYRAGEVRGRGRRDMEVDDEDEDVPARMHTSSIRDEKPMEQDD